MPRKSHPIASKQQQRKRRRYKLPRLTATMTCEEAFRVIARGCLDDLAAHQKATCEGDREALHQMRIALTRLRTARSFFAPFVSCSEWSRLKAELKWLNKHLSRARDLDVALKRVISADSSSKATPLDGAWRDASDTSHRHLNRALHSRRYRMLLRDASIWIEKKNTSPTDSEPSSEGQTCSLAAYSARQLDRWHTKILKQGRTVEDMNASQRHRLRIKSKRLRYALEIFGQLLPNKSLPEVKELLKRLRKIQKCLGQLNDAEQGRAIACTLKKSEQSAKKDVTGWHSLFPTGRKVEERAIKNAVLAFREMADQKLC